MSGQTLELTQFLRWIMVFTGSWRLAVSSNHLVQSFYNCYSIIFQMSLLWFFLSLIFNLPTLLHKKNFQLISENVGYAIIVLIMLAKLIICQTAKLRKLIVRCITEEKRTYEMEPELIKKNLNVHVKKLNRIIYVVVAFSALAPATFSIANYSLYAEFRDLNSTDKPLPLPIWYPFDPMYYYATAFVVGLYLTMIGTVYNVATQVLFLTLTTYIASQLKALKIYGKYSHLYCQSKTTDVAEYEENEVLRFFKSICSKHQDIIRFVDEVNLAMGNVLFMEYFLNSINIAAVMIRILMMSNTRSMLVFCIVLLLHQILQLFWMSWHANEIQIQSSSLSDALFQSKWYEQSERVKKIIFIVMMRSKKPLYIFIGPFFPMSIRTGIASMKAAYSYVTMIFTVASKD